MTVNRSQARGLILPGCYQAGGHRGVPFTDDEIEAAVDAYCAGGIDAAVKVVRGLKALPLVLRQRQARLAPLRSVSPAYKLSQIPNHFRSNQEATHVSRRSTQKAPRRTPQPPDTGWHGRTEADVGDNLSAGGGFLITGNSSSSISPGHFTPGSYITITDGTGTFMPLDVSRVTLASDDPPKPMPVEIKAGELVAWRCWRRTSDKRLLSMTNGTEWEIGKTIEGDMSSGLGVHAWKTQAQAEKYARQNHSPADVAIGTVELWGEVIEHDEGYRAQFGELQQLVGRVPSTGPTQPSLSIAVFALGVAVFFGIVSAMTRTHVDPKGAATSAHHCSGVSCRR